MFLLPSGLPDFIPVSQTGSTLTIVGGSGPGLPDFVNQWLPAYNDNVRLRLVMSDGSSQYVVVTDATDNLDGTQTLQLDHSLGGGSPGFQSDAFQSDAFQESGGSGATVAMIQLLELVRFDTDAFQVSYSAGDAFTRLPILQVQR